MSRRTCVTVAMLAAAVTAAATGCSGDDSSDGASPFGGGGAGGVTIVYEVDAPSGVGDISYTEADGTIRIEEGVELPWRLEFAAGLAEQTGSTPQVSVLDADTGSAGADQEELTCRVTVHGDVVSEQTNALQAMCSAPGTRMAPGD
ncbi:MmpS family transport accessory protein [Streptomyces radicis]|nr:MmpS family transport accessory protein [Streptomyces radicis]